jgi:hypothetical protein
MISDTIITALIFGVAQLGAAKLLITNTLGDVKATKETVQAHSVMMASTAAILQTIQTEVKQNSDNQKELFECRNKHDLNLNEVNTLHRLKRCEQIIVARQDRSTKFHIRLPGLWRIRTTLHRSSPMGWRR